MFLILEFDSDTPIYLQIRNKIIEAIAKGTIKNGEKLPSVRQLASSIAVNLHTINKAYNLLKDEGYVTVDRRIGVIVNVRKADQDEIFKNNFKEKLELFTAEGKVKGISKEEMISLIEKSYENFEGSEDK